MTNDDLPTSKVEMALKCKSCGKVATYQVGHIILDPEYVQEIRHEDPTESLRLLNKVDWAKWVSFTGYFLCQHCGSGGPWTFSVRREMVQMMIRAVTRTLRRVFFSVVPPESSTAPHQQNLCPPGSRSSMTDCERSAPCLSVGIPWKESLRQSGGTPCHPSGPVEAGEMGLRPAAMDEYAAFARRLLVRSR